MLNMCKFLPYFTIGHFIGPFHWNESNDRASYHAYLRRYRSDSNYE